VLNCDSTDHFFYSACLCDSLNLLLLFFYY